MSELTADGDGEAKYVVLSTAPDRETASRLADLLVQRRVAACVNVLPGVSSHYWWEGQLQHGEELLLLVKTDGAHLAAAIAAIESEHPYECPEVIALPVAAGSTAYLDWIGACLMPAAGAGAE